MANKTTEIKNLIGFLEKNNFYAECPWRDSFKLKEAHLFALDEFNPEAEELYKEMKLAIAEPHKPTHKPKLAKEYACPSA